MKKRILSVFLVVVMLFIMLPTFTISSFAETSGTTGDCTWSLVGAKLTISGNGAMEDYYTHDAPWGSLITELIIEEGVTTIGGFAFFDCCFSNVIIPNSVTIIGDSAFFNCCDLSIITMGNRVTTIGSSAFQNCGSLTFVTIPDSVITIGDSAFWNCDSIRSITIPDSVTTIGDSAFCNCDSLTTVNYLGSKCQWDKISIGIENISLTNAVINYEFGEHAYDSVVTVPTCTEQGYTTYTCKCGDTYVADYVDSLGHNYSNEFTVDIEPTCYTDGSKSKHCTRCDSQIDFTIIPATNHIDKCYCYEYEVVSETDKRIKITKYLGKEANVEIPAIIDGNTVVAIGESAFAENSTIISIEIPDTVKTIGKNAFFLCYNLANVVLPEGLTTIEYSAFSYCTGLINIKIPDSVTEIGESAFSYCSSLETINIPSEITYIRKNTFRSCSELSRIIVPDNVEIIDEYAFAYCSSLVDIWLHISIDIICENAFSYSNGFSTVYYAGAETEWNNITIADKKLLNSVQIHYNVSVGEIDSHWQEYSIDATCTVDGEYGYECLCGYKISTGVSALEHEFDEEFTIDKEPTYDETGSKSRHCSRCDEVTDITEIPMLEALKNGWTLENGKWAYYVNNEKLINKWIKDSVDWCYIGADGYCLTNVWAKDSIGWCYLDSNGRMIYNKWLLDSGKWYFIDANGYMVSNKWMKDSKDWCYLGDNGYCVTNKWVKDSHGWCYLGSDGRMATNKWIKDSVGWCYVGANGYCLTNAWVKDSVGWCYLDSNGRMLYSSWVEYKGDIYYIGSNGYMVTGTQIINGTTYNFASNGALIV